MSESVDIAALRALLSAVERPWEYRPYEHDDWGFIRGPERESLIGKVKPVVALSREGHVGPDNHDHHRRTKTDPYEPVGRLIVEVVNAAPLMLDQIEALRAENAKLREVLEPFASFAPTFVDADGWTGPMNKERIVDWFGPSDFRRAADTLTPTKEHPHAAS